MSDRKVNFDSYSKIDIDITQRIVEEQDKFIFEVISNWFEETYQLKISKRILKRALDCFKEEHLEEFAILKKEMEESEDKSCSNCKYWLLDKNDENRKCKYCFEMDEWKAESEE